MHGHAGRGGRATLAAPAAWAAPLAAFARRERLAFDVAVGREGTVRVVAPKGRRASSAAVLSVGGWIACPAARRAAVRLGLPPGRMGRLLDLLRIKVKNCELGCF